MTEMFLCNGCGVTLPFETIAATIEPQTFKGNVFNSVEHLCQDCYKAIQVFLNDRMNEKGKGVNTGFTTSSNSIITTPMLNVSGSTGGNLTYFATGIPENTPVNTNGEKKKTRRRK